MNSGFPKAILFDLDDTILCYGSPTACWRGVCGTYATQLGDIEPDTVLEAIDTYRRWYWSDSERHRRGRLDLMMARREMVAGAFAALNLDNPDLAVTMADAFGLQREVGLKPFEGAVETLCQLRAQGVRLALITNGAAQPQRDKVTQHKLTDYFDCIIIEGEFGCGKPDEKVYLHAMEQLQVAPHETWMVGDNLEWEVEAPQRLGIFSIWMDAMRTGLPKDSAVQPDRIILSITELLEDVELTNTQGLPQHKPAVAVASV